VEVLAASTGSTKILDGQPVLHKATAAIEGDGGARGGMVTAALLVLNNLNPMTTTASSISSFHETDLERGEGDGVGIWLCETTHLYKVAPPTPLPERITYYIFPKWYICTLDFFFFL
jgi:hypothetical protein